MGRLAFILLAAAAAFAADDSWAKVKELKGGSEIRVFKKGVAKPVEAKLDEARDEDIVVVLKNEQVAIPKEQIDRIDARPKSGSRMTTETKSSSSTTPDAKPPAGMAHGAPVPGGSYSSGASFGGKPGYETVYRRPSPAPAKK